MQTDNQKTDLPVTVRPANDTESLAQVHLLRQEVFINELGYEIKGSFHESGETARAHAQGALLLAESGTTAVGSMAIDWWNGCDTDADEMRQYRLSVFRGDYPAAAIVTVRKWLVLESFRSLRVCKALLRAAVRFVADKPDVQFVCIDCLPELSGHYRTFGFRQYAPVFRYGGSTAACIPMCLVLDDHKWLSRIRSPLLPLLRAIGRCDNPAARDCFQRIEREWRRGGPTAGRRTAVAECATRRLAS
jgi:hypothetical protein